MEFKRVVVTGLGALTPIGNSIPEYWEGLRNGVSGAAPITSFDTTLFKTKFACEVKGFDADAFLGRKDARKLDPFVQYALYTTEEAVKDAGLDFEKLDVSKIGVIWGSGIGGLKTFLDEVTAFAKGDGTPRFNPFFIPKMILDIAAGQFQCLQCRLARSCSQGSSPDKTGSAITILRKFVRQKGALIQNVLSDNRHPIENRFRKSPIP